MAVIDFTMSPQKLLSEEVVTRVLSVRRCGWPPTALVGAGAPGRR